MIEQQTLTSFIKDNNCPRVVIKGIALLVSHSMKRDGIITHLGNTLLLGLKIVWVFILKVNLSYHTKESLDCSIIFLKD